MARATTIALCALLSLPLGCRDSALHSTGSALRLSPAVLDFGSLYLEDVSELDLTVTNDGRTPLTLTWEEPAGAPFTLVDPPLEIPSGDATLRVRFAPTVEGRFSHWLGVGAVGLKQLKVALVGIASPVPECPASTCNEPRFSRTLKQCVDSPSPDGTACDAQTLCIAQATCQSGRCVGAPVDCEDHDACTVDVCNAETGCEHLPRPPCPGDGLCNVGVCDTVTGCALAPSEDGATCGDLQTCNAAQVCISGACVVRDPPDGYVCAEASPCQGEGRCVADVCVRAGPVGVGPIQPTWRFDSQLTGDVDAGVPPSFFHDFVLEPQGELTLGNFFQAPMKLRANTPAALSAPLGVSRRCIIWNARLVCADYPATPNGKVTALDPASGAALWTYDVRTAKPEWVAITSQIFMARLAVQGADRLAALFEAYPLSTAQSPNTQCRNYFLVVLDARGQQVMAQRVMDPLLNLCNHPHPYGLASDAVGNLFIAFSPTSSPQAPLIPDRPVLLMSYTHDGVFRWKLTDYSMKGGELAIARGLLYPENSSVALTAATGQPSFALPEDLGRAVVANARLVPAPLRGANTLRGYEAGVASLRWIHTLPPSTTFWSDQLRLATWHTSRGDRTVALTFTEDSGGLIGVEAVHAIDVRTGGEAFTCPVNLPLVRTAPQLFEVANGSLGVMTGALDPGTGAPGCGKCDPPYAGSAGEFLSLPLPGISPADEPWVGTFGGAGHDHHEDTPALPTTN